MFPANWCEGKFNGGCIGKWICHIKPIHANVHHKTPHHIIWPFKITSNEWSIMLHKKKYTVHKVSHIVGLVKVQTTIYNIHEKHKESNSIVIKALLLQSTKQQNQFKYMLPQNVSEVPFWNSWYHQVFLFLRAVHSTILLHGFWLMRVPALSNPQVHVICAGHVSFCHVGFYVFGNILWTWPMECGINIERQISANWSYKHLLLEGCQVPYVIGLYYEKDSFTQRDT